MRALVCGLLLAFFFAPAAGWAQDARTAVVAKFQLADAYLRAGQAERAIPLLEDLHAEDPESPAIFEKLKTAYRELKRYDEAIRLVEDRLRRTPSPALAAEKASLLYERGDEAAAFAAWDAALGSGPGDQNGYRTVYLSLYESRLFDRAIAVLERGRTALADPTLFQQDLAFLYGLVGDYERAMREYFGLLAARPQQLSFVKTRLGRLVEQEGALQAAVAETERAVRQNPLDRALRELSGWLYLEAGDFRKAFEASRAVDRLEQENGRVLFAFAQTAADAGAFDVAAEAFQEILTRYPDSPSASNAHFGRARMHESQAGAANERAFDAAGNRVPAPHYDAALEAYRGFVRHNPSHPLYPEALHAIARLQADVFRDLGAAEAAFRELTAQFPTHAAALQSRYDLGRIALARGDLDAARIQFGRLEDELKTGELAERARFELALLDFYAGQFESALARVQALNLNPSLDVSNDAIELKVLLQENRGPDSLDAPLRAFARAALLERQQMPAEALAGLERVLAEFPGHPLADDARYRRAAVLRALGRTDEAIRAYAEVQKFFPQSSLADRSLFALGELHEAGQDPEAAVAAYLELLEQYPGSLLAAEARARVRRLRGSGA